MRIRTRYRFAVSALTLLLGVRAAHADDDDTRALDAAKKAFAEGVQRVHAGDAEGARILFAQSYAARPTISALKNLAIAEFDSGHFLEASGHFKEYAASLAATPAFAQKDVPDYLRRCNEHLAHVHVVAPVATVVLLDGKKIDASEVIDVNPGDHTVSLRGTDQAQKVSVATQQTVEVNLAPVSSPPPASAPPALLQPPAPPSPSPAPVIAHERERQSSSFWTPQHVVAVSLTGAAVVALGIGTGMGIAANNEQSTYQGLGHPSSYNCTGISSSYCSSVANAASAQRTDGYVSTGAFVTAGVLAVAAFAFWIVPSHTESQSSFALAPSLGPGTAGVAASGHF